MHASRTLLAALLFFSAAAATSAQAGLSIAFFDKRVYVPGAEIPVKVTIRNETSQTWRFKLADEKRLSIGFDVRTLGNRQLEASDAWKRAMASNVPVFYRELALQPGEEYAFIEDLRHYIAIVEPGTFIIRCTLWPELLGQPAALAGSGNTQIASSNGQGRSPIVSNTLTLSVRPGAPTPAAAESFRHDTLEILRAERIGPDEVVSRTIRARQKAHWNEFFLYLDIESLLRNNQDKRRFYDRESDDGRRRMLEAYRADLMNSVVDSDIVVIPSSFEIVETRYGPSSGTVVVIQKFAYDGFSMVKEYSYALEKRDDIWFIVAYTVRNKGTE